MKAFSFAALAVLLAGCGVSLTLDPTGYACASPGDCPSGYRCASGTCQPEAARCAGVVCTPRGPTCADASTARQFASTCNPSSGACEETSAEVSCPNGCAAGLCTGAPCTGVVCNSPPEATCLSATTLRTFPPTGTCGDSGGCSYPPMDTACAGGCANGACAGDPCAGKVCEPKPPTCVGSALRTFAAGVCTAGTCDYAATDTACPGGCAAGACTTVPLTFAQVLPRLDFNINAIDQAPGSSGATALAVGNAGVAAWWNGATWTKLTTNSTRTLNSVWFATATRAYVAGDNKTLLRVTFSTAGAQPVVTPINLTAGSGGARLVAVHGVGDPGTGALERVAVVSDTGEVWRLAGVAAPVVTQRALSGNAPYAMNSVFVNVQGLRVAGACNNKPCVGNWTALGNTLFEDIDSASTGTFSALGPIFGLGDFAFAGRPGALRRHGQVSPYFDDVGVPTPLSSAGTITGITPIEGLAATRGLYLLGDASLTRANSATSLEVVFELYNARQRLSPNEANGVLVTDTRTTFNVNDVVRRTALGAPALDLGEDWAAVSSLGPLSVLVGEAGDVAWRVGTQPTWEFRRGPAIELRDGVAATFGPATIGAVMVGAAFNGGAPTATPGLRFEAPNTLVRLTSPSALALNAVCRVSDGEFYAVGEDGDIATLGTGTAFTTMSSPTTRVLYDVDCQASGAVKAVACGSGGTLLRLQAGAWAAVPNTPFTAAQVLNSCRFATGGLYVAGDNVFARFDGAAWTSLPAQPRLRELVVLSPNDIYALSGTSSVVRFNGAAWSTVYTSPTPLRSAAQQSGQVQVAGQAGQLAESR